MKIKRNKRTLCLAAAALALLVGAAAGRAMAYFTACVTAEGGHELELGFTTTIPNENVENWTKNVTITNTGGKDCYVRIKVFAGEAYKDRLTFVKGSWESGKDGYYYWKEILTPGSDTGSLLIEIDHTGLTESFNVIVVQECMPVPYDENGNALTWDQADWDQKADVIVKTETDETVNGGEDKE